MDQKSHRVILIGDSYVGKTAILMRYITKSFNNKGEETVGAAFHPIEIFLPNSVVKLQIWDTAGQERYKSLGPIYYHGASAAIFIYDSTNIQTFQNIGSWLSSFKEVAGNYVPCVLVGNKVDLENNQVSPQIAAEFADSHNMTFIETSAKTGFNIETLFYSVALNFQDVQASSYVKDLSKEQKNKSCSCSLL